MQIAIRADGLEDTRILRCLGFDHNLWRLDRIQRLAQEAHVQRYLPTFAVNHTVEHKQLCAETADLAIGLPVEVTFAPTRGGHAVPVFRRVGRAT